MTVISALTHHGRVRWPAIAIARLLASDSLRGSSITNRSLIPEVLLRMLERVIVRTQFGRCLTVRLNVPSIEEIKTWRRPWTTD